MSRRPLATASVLAFTTTVTAFGVADPRVLALLQRTPEALARGEWWRLGTPLFVNRGGWPEIAVNLAVLAVLGAVVESLFGRRRWLVLYFVPGIVGEVAGYAWKPSGAGSSVANAGLLGALAARLLLANAWTARVGGALVVAGAVALTVARDLHGPPVLAGALLAAAAMRWDRRGAPEREDGG